VATLREVLLTLSKVMAPFTPFIAEEMYQFIASSLEPGEMKESVHLEEWPDIETKIETRILGEMAQARKVVELGLALRAEAGIKVKQPLSKFSIFNFQFSNELRQIIAEELNVKSVEISGDKEINGDNVIVKEDGGLKVALYTEITEELKKEGLVREIVRAINQMRKKQKLTISDYVIVNYETNDEMLKNIFIEFADGLKKNVLAKGLINTPVEGEEIEIDKHKIKIFLSRCG
jgi:isoleucyl-tRNA synthetase